MVGDAIGPGGMQPPMGLAPPAKGAAGSPRLGAAEPAANICPWGESIAPGGGAGQQPAATCCNLPQHSGFTRGRNHKR